MPKPSTPKPIRGTGGDDILVGTHGVDSILGGKGNDTISGGLSGDILNGGLGADTFVWNTANHTEYYGDNIKGGREQATDDTIRLDYPVGYDLNQPTIQYIDQILFNQNLGGGITISDQIMQTADSNNDGIFGDLLIKATPQVGAGVGITGEAVLSSNVTLIVDGSNLSGNDIITGTPGNDTISAGAGTDTVNGAGRKRQSHWRC